LFRSSWTRLIAVALIVSASYPSIARASEGAAASNPAAEQLAQAIADAEFNTTVGEGIVEQVPQFCRSQECLHAVAGLKAVTARQRVVLQGSALTRSRIHQTQNLLIASFRRVIAAFEADYPEYKERIENPGDLSSLSSLSATEFPTAVPRSYELPPVSLRELPNQTPLASTHGGPGVFGSVEPMCAGGCSKAACKTKCVQLGAVFALMCAAYGPVCPICAAICYVVLASQVAKCYMQCEKCPNA
jgi:hypothetical protein